MPKFIDLTNQQFGEWIAVSYAGNGKWNCTCSCDRSKIIQVQGKSLRSGASKSCGHDTAKLKDLTGEQFGRWVVLGYAENGFWDCECTCQKHTHRVVRGTDLRAGNSTNCGCIRSEKMAERNSSGREKLDGKHFGEWDVLEYIGNKHYKCRCSCGKIKDVASRDLKDGISKSCGHNNGTRTFDDLTGQIFGKLTVEKYMGYKIYKCKCACGNTSLVRRGNLLNGSTQSCGCAKASTITEDAIRIKCKQYEIAFNEKPFILDLAIEFNVHPGSMRRILNTFDYSGLLNTTYSSRPERDICRILDKLKIKYITHNRKVLNGQELDIYIPEKKLAIEFNGDYWHSDEYKDKYYHQQKTINCAKQGIHLIHIFEHEWNNSETQKKIVDYLKLILVGADKVLYARNTELTEIDNATAKEFIDSNHFQYYSNALINIALRSNSDIVAVMTFGKPRFNNNYQYELIRLCSKSDTSIIGGTEKMFKYFLNKYNPQSILTYCNIAKFTGNIYTKLGFKPIQPKPITEPNYLWINTPLGAVLTRYQTQKQSLIDKGLGTIEQSEDEIMTSLNFLKIYDSGNLRLEWKREEN